MRVAGLRGAYYAIGNIILALTPAVTLLAVLAAIAIPGFGTAVAWLFGRFTAPAGVLGLAMPYLWAGLKEFAREDIFKEKSIGERAYFARADVLGNLPGQIRYLVLGHTHRLVATTLEKAATFELWFINTGTWTPTFNGPPNDPRAGTVHPVVAFTRGGQGYTHRVDVWDDAGGRAIPAIMLDQT